MLKRIIFFATFAIATFGLVTPAYSQENPRIASLVVSVWPEYDQPGVLVQYQGELNPAEKSALPRAISFLVPKGAGIGATCGIKSDGSHTSETWKESNAGDEFVNVTYQLDVPEFHVEFYYNPLTGNPAKTMEYRYKALSPVDDLHLDIQHPLKATDLVITPPATEQHSDKEGFTYHSSSYKQVAAGQTLSTKIAYTKTDPGPSVSGQKSAPKETPKENIAGLDPNLAIVVGVVVAAFGLVGYSFWSRRRESNSAYAAHSPAHATRGGFCTECGNPTDPGDKFCARCGTGLRGVA